MAEYCSGRAFNNVMPHIGSPAPPCDQCECLGQVVSGTVTLPVPGTGQFCLQERGESRVVRGLRPSPLAGDHDQSSDIDLFTRSPDHRAQREVPQVEPQTVTLGYVPQETYRQGQPQTSRSDVLLPTTCCAMFETHVSAETCRESLVYFGGEENAGIKVVEVGVNHRLIVDAVVKQPHPVAVQDRVNSRDPVAAMDLLNRTQSSNFTESRNSDEMIGVDESVEYGTVCGTLDEYEGTGIISSLHDQLSVKVIGIKFVDHYSITPPPAPERPYGPPIFQRSAASESQQSSEI